MKFKIDVSQPVLDARGESIPGDGATAAADLVRLRAALTSIEGGADDPEQIAKDALDAIEDEPKAFRDLIEEVLNKSKVKYVDNGQGGRMAIPDEPDPTPRERQLAGRLLIKIHARDTLELSSAEVKYLEKRSGILSGPVPHVRLLMALHPERDWGDGDEEDDEDELDS